MILLVKLLCKIGIHTPYIETQVHVHCPGPPGLELRKSCSCDSVYKTVKRWSYRELRGVEMGKEKQAWDRFSESR